MFETENDHTDHRILLQKYLTKQLVLQDSIFYNSFLYIIIPKPNIQQTEYTSINCFVVECKV